MLAPKQGLANRRHHAQAQCRRGVDQTKIKLRGVREMTHLIDEGSGRVQVGAVDIEQGTVGADQRDACRGLHVQTDQFGNEQCR